jgi:eukaryotic-like serine/threonine-protein kinase
MTLATICPKCQTVTRNDAAGFCSNCGSGMLPIVLAKPVTVANEDLDPPDMVILQNSIGPQPQRPPSSRSSTETLILSANEGVDSSSIRLGSHAVTDSKELPSGISSTNKFTLIEELGRGGMGVIIRGRDKVLHRDVALKVIRDQGDDLQRERFIKEAQITGQLEHPNIVPVHEFGVDHSGRIFFAMKLVRGRTLAEIIDGHRKNDEQTMAEYPLTRLVTILVQVCHAVAFAHSRGVIHRDLKPSNIMLGDFGEVMLMDWGLAKVEVVDVPNPAGLDDPTPTTGHRPTVHKLDETHDGAVLGTPVYMPPEQAMGQISSMDARSDVYALGAILYEMLTLRTPVEGEEIKEVLHKVILGHIAAPEVISPERTIPRDLSAVAMKSLSLRPDDRYPDVIHMRRDLELFLDGRVVSARNDSFMEVLIRFGNRNRMASYAVGSVLCVLIVVVILGYVANLAQRRVAESERQRAEMMRHTAEAERSRAELSGTTAEQERQRAISAQHQAEEQHRLADEARSKTVIALESESRLRQRSEQTAHFISLSLASEQIARRDYDAARASLDACPVRLRDWSWRRLALLCHQNLAQWNDHIGSVKFLASGMNGQRLASAGEDGSVVMVDSITRHHLFELKITANAMAMAKEQPLLIVADAEKVSLFHASTGNQLGTVPIPNVRCIAIHANGTRAIFGDAVGALSSLDLNTLVHHVIGRLNPAASWLSMNHEGEITAGDRNGKISIFDTNEKLASQKVLPGTLLALSPQGLAMMMNDQRHVSIYDAVSGSRISQLSEQKNTLAQLTGCFSPNGKLFAIGSEARTTQVFDSLTAAPVITLEGHTGTVLALSFINGSELLASGSTDGSVRLWNAHKSGYFRELCPPDPNSPIYLKANDEFGLIKAGSGGGVRSLAINGQAATWETTIGFPVRIGYCSPNNSVVALGGDHGQVRLIDARTGDVVGAHGFGTGVLQSIIMNDDLSRLFVTDDDGMLHGLDRVNGRRFSVRIAPSGFSSLALTADKKQIVCAGSGGKITWISCEDGTTTRVDTTRLQTIKSLRWSPDGTRLAIAGDDMVLLWNPNTREVTSTLRGHSATVSDISFSSDGNRLISSSHDGTVRIWDIASARTLIVIDAHSGSLRSAHMTKDDHELVTIGNDGRVLIWSALEQQSWD